MSDIHTHTKTGRGRECRTKGEHGLPILPLPFIYPSLYHPPPLSPLSALSFSLSPLCSCLCLGPARVWRTQTKECCLSWRKSKGLGTPEGRWGVGGGWVSGLERHCQSCGYPLLFLGSLLIRRLPRPSLLSLISFSVHLFRRASVFFRSEGWDCRKREMRQMSGMKLFTLLAAWLLQARWRSALSAPPLVVLVVNTPGEVLLTSCKKQHFQCLGALKY